MTVLPKLAYRQRQKIGDFCMKIVFRCIIMHFFYSPKRQKLHYSSRIIVKRRQIPPCVVEWAGLGQSGWADGNGRPDASVFQWQARAYSCLTDHHRHHRCCHQDGRAGWWREAGRGAEADDSAQVRAALRHDDVDV